MVPDSCSTAAIDVGVGLRCRRGLPADQLSLGRGAQGLAYRQEVERLDEVALAMAVLALDQDHAGREVEFEVFVVAEVL